MMAERQLHSQESSASARHHQRSQQLSMYQKCRFTGLILLHMIPMNTIYPPKHWITQKLLIVIDHQRIHQLILLA